ncbi:unnamed protein product [Ixodes pacificus]
MRIPPTPQKRHNQILYNVALHLVKAHLRYHNDHCSQLRPNLIVAKRLLKSLDLSFHSHSRKLVDKILEVNSYLYANGPASKSRELDTLLPRNDQAAIQRNADVTIPDDLPLTAPEHVVLSKGLSFVPAPQSRPDPFSLHVEGEQFF